MNGQERFGRYEIVRKLGRSMADVYLARDTEHDRPAIVKIIECAGTDSARRAVEAERRGAQLQRQLRECDKRILEVYEWGEQDSCFFVALEYFPGRSIAEIIEAERRLEPKRAARYAAECCSQLRTLHEFTLEDGGRKTPVVHGDVKPSNIQIGPNDQLRLLDFGIAKIISAGHNLTHHQLGSPGYCSPERLRRAQVDIHADLWAVGVSLYEMLVGKPAFQAQDTRNLENLIQSRKPPVMFPEDCPAELKSIILKALAGDLERRYPSAEAFETDLRAFVEGRQTQAAYEKAVGWKTNATILKAPAPQCEEEADTCSVKRNSRQARARCSSSEVVNLAIALLAGVLAGLILFLPIAYYFRLHEISRQLTERKNYLALSPSALASDWQLYQMFKDRSAPVRRLFPMRELEASYRTNLLKSAEGLIYGFRRSSEDKLDHLDWANARLCLLYALQIDPSNRRARGELHLCDGYLALQRNSKARAAGFNEFQRAEALLPLWPDPHLGMARLYVYNLHNPGAALAEFHQAEQLGYKLGPRETQQKADAYLFRAEWEMKRAKQASTENRQERAKWLHLARGDIERARILYEPIAGFSHVDANLKQIDQDQSEQIELETSLATSPAPNTRRVASRRPPAMPRRASSAVRPCTISPTGKRDHGCTFAGEPHPVLLKARLLKRSSLDQWR